MAHDTIDDHRHHALSPSQASVEQQDLDIPPPIQRLHIFSPKTLRLHLVGGKAVDANKINSLVSACFHIIRFPQIHSNSSREHDIWLSGELQLPQRGLYGIGLKVVPLMPEHIILWKSVLHAKGAPKMQ